jgi:light-harvesting complex 1 beta chain
MSSTRTDIPAAQVDRSNRSYLPIFVLSFAVFLAIALAGAVLGLPWRSWLPGAEGVKSLVGGVHAAVYTFMSNIL